MNCLLWQKISVKQLGRIYCPFKLLRIHTEWMANHVTDDQLKPYYRRRSELSADQGCMLWGLRVVIPPCYRERLLNELHEEHHGIVRMKGLARCYLWWPGLDADIEEKIKDCETCQSVRNLPPEAPMHPCIWPTRVW